MMVDHKLFVQSMKSSYKEILEFFELPQPIYDIFEISFKKNSQGGLQILFFIDPNATSSEDASIEDKILQFDVVDSVLTGGDSCRYCVDQCPENQ